MKPEEITLNQFQALATRTASEPKAQAWFAVDACKTPSEDKELATRIDIIHAVLGMAGELGEVCELVKKAMFNGRVLDKADVRKETGDVLWYIASVMCRALDCTLEELAMDNIAKLRKRYPEKYSHEASLKRADVSYEEGNDPAEI